jgi:hypothetical protein
MLRETETVTLPISPESNVDRLATLRFSHSPVPHIEKVQLEMLQLIAYLVLLHLPQPRLVLLLDIGLLFCLRPI